MKFSHIMFGCPPGARKWRISYFAMLLHNNKRPTAFRYKSEVTLGCRALPSACFVQPRVTSVLSWYLTSVINLSFCGFGNLLAFARPYICKPLACPFPRDALFRSCGGLKIAIGGWFFLRGTTFSKVILLNSHLGNRFRLFLASYCTSVGLSSFKRRLLQNFYRLLLKSVPKAHGFWEEPWGLPVHWYHLFVSKGYHRSSTGARWDTGQNTHDFLVQNTDFHAARTIFLDFRGASVVKLIC